MLKEFFTSLLYYFVNITTAVLIAAAIFLNISGQPVGSDILWEILLGGLITALPSALLVCLDTKSGKVFAALWIAHFLLIYAITLVMLNLFGWCEITPFSAILTFFADVFIYLFTSYLHYLMDKSHVALMNEKLRTRYRTCKSEKEESI